MRRTGAIAILAVAAGFVTGAPNQPRPRKLRDVQRLAPGYEKNGKYIVSLKEGVSASEVLGPTTSEVQEFSIIPGFATEGGDDVLDILLSHPGVERVEEDGLVTIDEVVTQPDAPWGISRVTSLTTVSGPNTPSYPYTYDDSPAGAGSDIYILDTGIYIEHDDLEGRASWGLALRNYTERDGHGHGTHCAGTAVSKTYGIAKKAKVIAVKVLSDGGSGSASDLITGMEFALEAAQASKRPSVVSMSLRFSPNTAIDAAVKALTDAGVHVTASAGNNYGSDSSTQSPGRAPSANTVGATTMDDARSSFSNVGAGVDIYAPGSSIISLGISGPSSTAIKSGTSMSTPLVAGVIAYLIGRDGPISPAAMTEKIREMSLKNALSGIPSGTDNFLVEGTMYQCKPKVGIISGRISLREIQKSLELSTLRLRRLFS